MTTPAYPGAEASTKIPEIAASDADYPFHDDEGEGRDSQPDHNAEAKALLQRYLSEVHSFRATGNHALRDLEARLAIMPSDFALDEPEDDKEVHGARQGQLSQLIRPSLAASQRLQPQQPQPRRPDPGLQQRLQELSSYLHADLSKEQPERAIPPRPSPQPEPAPAGPQKIPTLPVLDRAWFEERFALMRTSMDRLTEQLPVNRLDALEAQFRELMERLAVRETARDPRPLDASLKELATYLADSKQWAVANEKRVKGLEVKLDRLSVLVSQSHAAISAAAKGLELVAKGTGEPLARKTADIVMARIGSKLDDQNSSERLDKLGREVAHLTAQSRHLARSAEERLEQIQTTLRDNSKPLPRIPIPVKPPSERAREAPGAKAAASSGSSHDELQTYLNQPIDLDDDYDSEMIAAAQHAARLADGPAQSASSQNGPVRYHIPYGEFLPDENSPPSRVSLIVAAAILALAGAIMLFLKWQEWTLIEPKPTVTIEDIHAPLSTPSKQARLLPAQPDGETYSRGIESAALPRGNRAGMPVVTGSTPAAPPLAAKPFELWVSSNAPDQGKPDASQPSRVTAEAPEASMREAAIKGDLNAQFSVGQSYLTGNDRDGNLAAPDPAAGLRWIRRSAERGYAPAQYKLATLYELGHGAARDSAEAETWYERAALQGHVKAMHNLAVLATAQNGKSANYVTAARWFQEAAAYGLVDSQFNLGILYERGLGVARDMIEAYRWFSIAARQGDGKARQKRDALAQLLSPAERQSAERLIAEWTPKQRSAEVNRLAPEPPVSDAAKPAAQSASPTTSAAVVSASWKPDLAIANKPAPSLTMVREAQRLLQQRGYDPGPADGVPGPRTQNAIRSFQRRAGLPVTGEASDALIAKLAFLPL